MLSLKTCPGVCDFRAGQGPLPSGRDVTDERPSDQADEPTHRGADRTSEQAAEQRPAGRPGQAAEDPAQQRALQQRTPRRRAVTPRGPSARCLRARVRLVLAEVRRRQDLHVLGARVGILLHNVGELVGDQPAPVLRVRCVVAGSERDVTPYRVRRGADGERRLGGRRTRVHSDGTEVPAEPRLEQGPDGGWQRLGLGPQHPAH